MTAVSRAAMEPARSVEVEAGGRIAGFDQDGAEAVERGGLLGDPQRVVELAGLGNEQSRWIDAKQAYPKRIGVARLAKALRHADPKDRRGGLFRQQAADESQREGGGSAGIACRGSVDFRQAGARKTAAQSGVEAFRAGGQKTAVRHHHSVTPREINVLALTLVEPFGEASLYPGDLVAQGRNGFPRQGMGGHGDAFSAYLFLLCSYRFQSASHESSGLDKNLFLNDGRRVFLNGRAVSKRGGRTAIWAGKG